VVPMAAGNMPMKQIDTMAAFRVCYAGLIGVLAMLYGPAAGLVGALNSYTHEFPMRTFAVYGPFDVAFRMRTSTAA
jgi:hypothetical protein